MVAIYRQTVEYIPYFEDDKAEKEKNIASAQNWSRNYWS